MSLTPSGREFFAPEIKETPLPVLGELLRIPEEAKLNPETRRTLSEATEEIQDLVYKPVTMGETSLAGGKLSEESIRVFTEDVERAKEAFAFFTSFLRDFKGEGEGVASQVALKVDTRQRGRVFLSFIPYSPEPDKKSEKCLGYLAEKEVYRAKIEVDTGSGAREGDYTLQSLKFRFEDREGEEIQSLRIEVHTRNREKDKYPVQVDSEVGGGNISLTHQEVKSLGEGEEALEKFRLLQSAFVINLVEKVESLKVGEEKIGQEGISGLVLEGVHVGRLGNAANRAYENLGIMTEEEKGEQNLRALREATKQVSPELVAPLRKSLSELHGIEEDSVPDSDIVVCAVFGWVPHRIVAEEIIPLNGKAPEVAEALANLNTLEPIQVDLRKPGHIVFAHVADRIMESRGEEEADKLINELNKLVTVVERAGEQETLQ